MKAAGRESPFSSLFSPDPSRVAVPSAAFLHQAAFVEHVGADNIVPHVETALARAQEVWARGPAQFAKVPAGSHQ